MTSRFVVGLVLLGVAGCGPVAEPKQAPTGSGEPMGAPSAEPKPAGGLWSACYDTFSPSGNPRGDLARLTRSCGPTGGMRAVTPVTVAQQSDRDPVDRYTFFVPRAGACYRVYAVGDRNIGDLDLLIRGPSGENFVADVTHDAFPVLPPQSPMCFDAAGLYMLEVSVFRGSGSYALQVWGNADGVGKAAKETRR